jgi:NarL family two-component system sensor histidine kinase LiaS
MLKRFRGLRWKLTLSYTVVTVATLLVVEILIIAGIGIIILRTNLLPRLLIYATETFIAPQVASYLDSPQPDIVSLTKWLETAFEEGMVFRSSQNPQIRLELGDFSEDTALMVLDPDLMPLAVFPEAADRASYASVGELAAVALTGENDPDRVSRISNGFLSLAVPVASEDGEVLGIVMMIMPFPPQDMFSPALSLIWESLILFTIIVGMIGTIFGYITARGLSRRLRSVASATGSWSQGDFSTFIQDRSGDEIGHLSQQLNRMAEQLQNLLQTKEELAALEERNRLARDLHDGVKQQVFATTMQVGAARSILASDTHAAREHLNEAERLARQAQSELDAILRELRPTSLKNKGLVQALREHVADWSRANDVPATFEVQGEGSLALDVEQALFRVTQEALSNIARHSQASQVEIELILGSDGVSITLSDDGVGFDVTAAEGKGDGLRSMRERVEALSGSLSLESTPGHGTCLTARIPVLKGAST